jgi:hypothetical protein
LSLSHPHSNRYPPSSILYQVSSLSYTLLSLHIS